MSDSDAMGEVGKGVSVLADLVKTAANSPEGTEAARNVGRVAVTVTRTLNNVLLPLAAVNYAFDRARQYFEQRFPADLAAKTADIPPEHVQEPKASVAGPALQGLAFAHEEPQLKSLYLELIAAAMDARRSQVVHPAFVEVLKQLTSEEARLLCVPLRAQGMLPVAQIYAIEKAGCARSLISNHVGYTQSDDGSLVEIAPLAAMVDNWIRLGLVEVSYTLSAVDMDGSDPYDFLARHPTHIQAVAKAHEQGRGVQAIHGVMRPTNFGQQFAKVVGILE